MASSQEAEFFVNRVSKNIRDAFVGRYASKVINLTEEEEFFAINSAIIHARFMYHGDKTNLVYGIIDVFLPKVRGFWVKLYGMSDRD